MIFISIWSTHQQEKLHLTLERSQIKDHLWNFSIKDVKYFNRRLQIIAKLSLNSISTPAQPQINSISTQLNLNSNYSAHLHFSVLFFTLHYIRFLFNLKSGINVMFSCLSLLVYNNTINTINTSQIIYHNTNSIQQAMIILTTAVRIVVGVGCHPATVMHWH